MEEAKQKRLATQPHGARSAGCFFKNPPGSPIGTGKMIDEMGMKGTRRGGALVSPIHANFIVTEGENARASDALALAEEIREKVRREHGIELEYEVELWSAEQQDSLESPESVERLERKNLVDSLDSQDSSDTLDSKESE
jgi:UDP-N-acetylenolpyruvoylglucosamine reductase